MASRLLDVYTPIPLNLKRGEGVYLYDTDDNAYLDTYAGIAVNALGHNHPAIKKALSEASQRYLHVSNLFRTDSEELLANRLCQHSGAEKVFFANSGSEVNEAALKLARKRGREISTEKTEILSVSSAFHGRTSGGVALSGTAEKRAMFAPILPGITHINFNDIDDLNTKMTHNVCAIFLELIHGSSGIYPLSETFINEVKRLAKENDALIIIDEVQTGLMRTGTMFAFEHHDITPDIITTAKALGGGLPLGAMLVYHPHEQILKPGDHGTTFGGNPLACALGNAVFDVLETQDFQQNLMQRMTYLKSRLEAIVSDYPALFSELRGEGYMWGLQCNDHAKTLQTLALKQGLLLNVTGGNVIRLLPSLTFNQADIDVFETKFRMALNQL